MENKINFKDQVVIVSGAGAGLGRAYALFFGKNGAKVVVNDLGTTNVGSGATHSAADAVVKEIKSFGGQAVANYDSVEFGEKIVKTAIDTFGRVDVLVNNAGFIRDGSFIKQTRKDWDDVLKVHLIGAYSLTKAAYPYMKKQKYGRIINITSNSGLYGNFGQTNYAAAKSALIGFTFSLARESTKDNILVNVVGPVAGTRMSGTVLVGEVSDKLKIEYVVPLIGYLASSQCNQTGQIFEAGGRWITKVRWQQSHGVVFNEGFTAEDVYKKIEQISDFTKDNIYPEDNVSSVQSMVLASERSGAQNKTSNKEEVIKSDEIFNLIRNYLGNEEGKALTQKVNAIFQFDITEKKGGPVKRSWVIDLKNGNGSVKEGTNDKADALFTMIDEDFISVCNGKLNPQMAFIQVIYLFYLNFF